MDEGAVAVQEARPPSPPVVQGFGCRRCGSTDLKQKKYTTGAGWALFVIGLIGAIFTFGVLLILCFGAMFLSETRNKCRSCGWVEKA